MGRPKKRSVDPHAQLHGLPGASAPWPWGRASPGLDSLSRRVPGIFRYAADASPEEYDAIAADRFPLSPRVRRWKAILDASDALQMALTILEELPQQQASRSMVDEFDLTDPEKTTIAVLLREAIATDPILTSDRVRGMKAILDKIEPELAELDPPR